MNFCSLQDLGESDESFLTEVFSGCVQYTNILKVCVLKWFHNHLPIQLSALFCGEFGKISTQPHPTLCIQFLDREAITKTIHCHWENRFVLQ